jgi:hypothetical protein
MQYSSSFFYVIVEKYKNCNKNNPLTPNLKDEGGGMKDERKQFIIIPHHSSLKKGGISQVVI